MVLVKSNNNHFNASEKLSYTILELIHQYPGIHKNKIKAELEKKGFASKSTIDKKIKELEKDELITHRHGNKKHHYYIKGYESTKHYDKELETVISNLEKTITTVKSTSYDYEPYWRDELYAQIDKITSNIKMIISEQKKERKNSDQYKLEDAILVDIVEQYSKYEIKDIKSEIKDAEEICKEIKRLREKNIIKVKKIQKVNTTSENKWYAVIETLDKIKENINDLHKRKDSLENIKSAHQDRIFRCMIKDIWNETNQDVSNKEIIALLKILYNFRRTQQNNIPGTGLLKVIEYFQRKLNPIEKNVLIERLEDTKQFSRDDIDWHITQFSIMSNRIIINQEKIYPLFYLTNE